MPCSRPQIVRQPVSRILNPTPSAFDFPPPASTRLHTLYFNFNLIRWQLFFFNMAHPLANISAPKTALERLVSLQCGALA